MSLQDDVFDVNDRLRKRSLTKHDKYTMAFERIVERLWQYETELEDTERVIADQLKPSKSLNIGDTCKECGQEWTGTL